MTSSSFIPVLFPLVKRTQSRVWPVPERTNRNPVLVTKFFPLLSSCWFSWVISSKLEPTSLHSRCRNNLMEVSTWMRCTGTLILTGSLKDILVRRYRVMYGFPRAESSITLHSIFIVHICKIRLLQPRIDGWGVLKERYMDRTWAGKTSRTCFPQVLFPSPLPVSLDAPYHGAPLKTKFGASWKTVALGHHFQRACVPLLGYWDAPDELQTDPYKAFSHFYESLLGCSMDYNFSRMS